MLDNSKIEVRAISVSQPIGTFYIGAIDALDLVTIAKADVRRLNENKIDEYIGIQRRLSPSRRKELQSYVKTYDATFPSAVILAVDEENVSWDPEKSVLTVSGTQNKPIDSVANILDGQHRVDGLSALRERGFEIPVSIFVGADVATQANIFATVNLAQTKVNRSIVYDLLDYEKKRSPQKSAHHISVALDQISRSPFHERIKRLGSATAGRENEVITQAAMVESLLGLLSADPMSDRNTFLRKLLPDLPDRKEHEKFPFRQMFIKEMDTQITEIVLNFFQAVRERWPESWDDLERQGNVLPKTNGLKALMRFLKPLYLKIAGDDREYVPQAQEFLPYLKKVKLDDADFNIGTFPPGTSGESRLYKFLIETLGGDESEQEALV